MKFASKCDTLHSTYVKRLDGFAVIHVIKHFRQNYFLSEVLWMWIFSCRLCFSFSKLKKSLDFWLLLKHAIWRCQLEFWGIVKNNLHFCLTFYKQNDISIYCKKMSRGINTAINTLQPHVSGLTHTHDHIT